MERHYLRAVAIYLEFKMWTEVRDWHLFLEFKMWTEVRDWHLFLL